MYPGTRQSNAASSNELRAFQENNKNSLQPRSIKDRVLWQWSTRITTHRTAAGVSQEEGRENRSFTPRTPLTSFLPFHHLENTPFLSGERERESGGELSRTSTPVRTAPHRFQEARVSAAVTAVSPADPFRGKASSFFAPSSAFGAFLSASLAPPSSLPYTLCFFAWATRALQTAPASRSSQALNEKKSLLPTTPIFTRLPFDITFNRHSRGGRGVGSR